jgi:peptidoglycan/xylan/chitin deacetylase (PgdA/CDA1 family)
LPVLQELKLPALCFVLPALSANGSSIWTDAIHERILLTTATQVDLTNFGLNHFFFADLHGIARLHVASAITTAAKSMPDNTRKELLEYLAASCPVEPGKQMPDFRLMTIDEIRNLVAKGFEIGLHTNTHPILSNLSRAEQEKEILGSAEILKQQNMRFIPLFAYPNGGPQDFNEDSIQVLKNAGLKAAVTSIDGFYRFQDDAYNIRRIPIGSDTTWFEFKARLSGLFYFLKRITV